MYARPWINEAIVCLLRSEHITLINYVKTQYEASIRTLRKINIERAKG